jgi:TPR repeat protein
VAEQGDAEAQWSLGNLYLDGQGVPQDYTQAAFWWSKAAEQGHAQAQYNLGLSYGFGRGVRRDRTQAATWFRKAAEQGNALAQYNLSVLYYNGQGAPRSYSEAYFWYDLAAAGIHGGSWDAEQAAKFRDEIESHLTPADLARVQERARKWSEAHQAKPQ